MLALGACQTGGVRDRMTRLAHARLYLVSDAVPAALIEAALLGGVDIVQLRMKDADDAAVLRVARVFGELCARHGALFIVNDRPDLAVQAGADGVHVGQDDVAVAQARSVVGPDRLVGLSTHSEAQIDAAAHAGIDYIGVGPVHATPTKPGRSAVGLPLVRYAAAHASVPFFAIGGIDQDNVGAVRDAGAQRIAVVRAIAQAEDVQAAAADLRAPMTEAPVGRA
jgi:thiamine-phosphate pyrophosphorylase